MSKLRTGIVGTGSISNEHINAYLHHPDVELCALCDIDETQLNRMGDRYGINSRYTDLDQMLQQQLWMQSVSAPGTVPTLLVLSKHSMLESMFCAKNRCPSLPATHKL